jgi:hypothetical protein
VDSEVNLLLPYFYRCVVGPLTHSSRYRRDLVAMLSVVSSDSVSKNLMLYTNLLQVLSTQLMTMDNDFFEVRFSKVGRSIQ